MRSSRGRAIGVVGLVLWVAATAAAQEVSVQTDRGPHYVGDPIAIQIVASAFEDEPTPEIRAEAVDGGSLRYAGVSDSTSTSLTYINGQLTRSKEVRFLYRYELVANRAGRLRVPAFVVEQGATQRATRPFDLDVQAVPTTGLAGLSVELPDGPIFVGQKVPVEVVLRIDREAQRTLLSIESTVPLFDAPNLRFLDDPVPDADGQLEIRTAEGVLPLRAKMSEEVVDGRTVLELRAKRTMIALSPEEIRVGAPRVVIRRGTRFRRDLFNQRQATAMELLMAEGDAVRLEVIEVPREGRPPSFAGAVGEGFSLEVGADRSVVQLGEPILLTFTLRGDGDLSMAGLPPFDAEGLFDSAQFRLPEEPPAGLVDEDGKRFEASVRVLDANVREIPAIAYSWFDARTRRFETTTSRPIALSVGAAEVIGADAVARRPASTTQAVSATGEGEPADLAVAPARSTSLAASGANLAVDADVARVLGGRARRAASPLLAPALYGLGLALLGLAGLDRRRRARDPRETARAASFSAALRGIDAVATASAGEGAAGLGRVLRELIAQVPEASDDVFDRLLAECDALRFAPAGAQEGLPEALVERARAFVSQKRAEGIGSGAGHS